MQIVPMRDLKNTVEIERSRFRDKKRIRPSGRHGHRVLPADYAVYGRSPHDQSRNR